MARHKKIAKKYQKKYAWLECQLYQEGVEIVRGYVTAAINAANECNNAFDALIAANAPGALLDQQRKLAEIIMRVNGYFQVPITRRMKYLQNFMNGLAPDKIKDTQGNPLTDGRLRAIISQQHPQVARAYQQGHNSIHFGNFFNDPNHQTVNFNFTNSHHSQLGVGEKKHTLPPPTPTLQSHSDSESDSHLPLGLFTHAYNDLWQDEITQTMHQLNDVLYDILSHIIIDTSAFFPLALDKNLLPNWRTTAEMVVTESTPHYYYADVSITLHDVAVYACELQMKFHNLYNIQRNKNYITGGKTNTQLPEALHPLAKELYRLHPYMALIKIYKQQHGEEALKKIMVKWMQVKIINDPRGGGLIDETYPLILDGEIPLEQIVKPWEVKNIEKYDTKLTYNPSLLDALLQNVKITEKKEDKR